MNRTILSIAGLSGIFWGGWVSFMGVHMDSDSLAYITAALNWNIDNHITLGPMWPPFYPLLIAWFSQLLVYPGVAAALISGLSISLYLWVVGELTTRITRITWTTRTARTTRTTRTLVHESFR